MTLYRSLKQLHQAVQPLSQAETLDPTHARHVHRRVKVYAAPLTLQQQWKGLKTLI